MNIKIFMATANSAYERDILRDFGQGIETWLNQHKPESDDQELQVRLGRWTNLNRPTDSVEYEYIEGYQPCDIAVMYGSWKPREKGHHVVRNSVAANAKHFICIETPLLNRRTDINNQYHRVGINGFLNQSAYWPKVDHVHAENQLAQLDITWPGWKSNTNGHVLLALQLPGDASLRGADINDWALHSVETIRSVTDRPIVIRSHPMISDRGFESHAPLVAELMKKNISNIKFTDGAVTPWAQDLKKAYCTVTYTSGLAIDSVLAGIPTVACDAGNFAWDISTRRPADINDIKQVDAEEIHEWLLQLAMCQWNSEQMRSGLVWNHVMTVFDEVV